jgi:hypothetical protein
MKAIEILAESKNISEAPASMLGQIAKRAGAGVLGAMGLNTWAGQINDKADVGMFANRYYKEFMSYLKGRNRSPNRATFGDLKAFMSQSKIPTHNVPRNPAGVANKDMVDSIFRQTAQEYLSGKIPGGSSGASGSVQQQPRQATGNVQQQPRQASGNAQQQQQPAVRQPQTPPPRVAQKPAQSAPAGGGVKSIIQQIATMSPKNLSKIEKAIQSARASAPTTASTASAAPTTASTASANATPPAASTPNTPTAQSPEDIRKTKQAAAVKAAQDQMAPFSKLPADQPATQAANTRQTKQAAAVKAAQDQMAPYSKVTPSPAVWKNNRKPNEPASANSIKQAPPAPTEPAAEPAKAFTGRKRSKKAVAV